MNAGPVVNALATVSWYIQPWYNERGSCRERIPTRNSLFTPTTGALWHFRYRGGACGGPSRANKSFIQHLSQRPPADVCVNTVVVSTLWLCQHCGCVNTMVVSTLWLCQHCGCVNTVVVSTLWLCQHCGCVKALYTCVCQLAC